MLQYYFVKPLTIGGRDSDGQELELDHKTEASFMVVTETAICPHSAGQFNIFAENLCFTSGQISKATLKQESPWQDNSGNMSCHSSF